MQLNMSEIPPGILSARWSHDAKASASSTTSQLSPCPSDTIQASTRHAIVYAAAMELVVMCNASREASEIGIGFITQAKQAIEDMTVITAEGTEVQETEPKPEDAPEEVVAPPRVRSRGRPKVSRYKSPIEATKGKKRKIAEVAQDTQNNAARRSRNEVHGPVTQPPRKCHSCGEYGHYRSTCGRKSSYVAGN